MKIIKLKVPDTYTYFERYVELVLKPFYGLGATDVKVLSRLYTELHTELKNDVPFHAAIRLISTKEARDEMQTKITVTAKRLNNKETDLEDPIFYKSLKRLKEFGLLDEKGAPNKAQLISIEDGGFGFNVIIKEEENGVL